MEKFGKSQPVKRVEDVRFLTGAGGYVDDIAPEGALFAYFLRSPVAHAEITTLDVTDARSGAGVHAVLTFGDLKDAGMSPYIAAALVDLHNLSTDSRAELQEIAESRFLKGEVGGLPEDRIELRVCPGVGSAECFTFVLRGGSP